MSDKKRPRPEPIVEEIDPDVAPPPAKRRKLSAAAQPPESTAAVVDVAPSTDSSLSGTDDPNSVRISSVKKAKKAKIAPPKINLEDFHPAQDACVMMTPLDQQIPDVFNMLGGPTPSAPKKHTRDSLTIDAKGQLAFRLQTLGGAKKRGEDS